MHPDFNSKINRKSDLETSAKKTEPFINPRIPKSSQNGVPKSFRNQQKFDSRPLHDPPAGTMVSQGAQGTKKVPREAKLELPGPPNHSFRHKNWLPLSVSEIEKFLENNQPDPSAPAHISTKKFSETKCPASHQTDQNLKS